MNLSSLRSIVEAFMTDFQQTSQGTPMPAGPRTTRRQQQAECSKKGMNDGNVDRWDTPNLKPQLARDGYAKVKGNGGNGHGLLQANSKQAARCDRVNKVGCTWECTQEG
jgi:hypothetical protein